MNEQIISTIFKFKRANADKWNELNPILQRGEPGFEIDTGLLKIGNGTDDWKTLKYVGSQESAIENKITEAFDEFVQEISEDGTVNTFKELVEYAANHKEEFSNLDRKVEQKIQIKIWEEND